MPQLQPQPFQIEPRFSASVDWTDLIQGIGYITLYGAGADSFAAQQYHLTPVQMDAAFDTRNLSGTGVGDTETNFDITVSVPFEVEAADAFINYTQTDNCSGVDHFDFTLQRISNSVTTQIGTQKMGVGNGQIRRELCKITCSRVKLGKGDTLRLVVGVDFTTTGNYTIGTDPLSRLTLTETTTGATINQSLILQLPVRLDT